MLPIIPTVENKSEQSFVFLHLSFISRNLAMNEKNFLSPSQPLQFVQDS